MLMLDERFIVGIGEILWDKFPTGKRLGGAPANFAYHAGQFGHDKDGASIQEAHETAVKVSAFVCTKKGAMPEIKN